MSNSRNTDSTSTPKPGTHYWFNSPVYTYFNKKFSENDSSRMVGQFLFTLPLVVTSTYPLDFLYTLKSIGTANAYRPSFFMPFIASNWRNLFKGYLTTYGQAGAKNFLMSNSSNVHGKVEESVIGEEQSHISHSDMELPFRTRFAITGITTGLLAGADLVFTNPFSIMRFFSQTTVPKPVLAKPLDYLKYGYMASPARFLSLYAGAGGYIVGDTFLKGPMEAMFPAAQYGLLGPVLTTLMTGWGAGLTGNVFGIIRNNQLKMANGSLKLPSMYTVGKQLYQSGGLKSFAQGGGASIIYTIVAYTALGMGDFLFNNVLFPEAKKPKAKKSSVQIEEVQVQGHDIERNAIAHTETPQEVVPVVEVQQLEQTSKKPQVGKTSLTSNKSVLFQPGPASSEKGNMQQTVEDMKKEAPVSVPSNDGRSNKI